MSHLNSSTIPTSVINPIHPLPPPPSKMSASSRQDSVTAPKEQFAMSTPGAPGPFSATGITNLPAPHEPVPVLFPPVEHLQEFDHESAESVSEQSDSESASASSSHDENGMDESQKDASDKQSARISNRSSPSVLSATIHQWPGYEEESHGLLDNPEEQSEDSENEDPDDPWRIQPDQRGWYLSLFLRLQPNIRDFIEGKDARVFFENSQLPLQDLGEIWNLSDLDRDGRLTLTEFCYAMHLSVARRHGLSLPPHLPPSLRSSTKSVVKVATESITDAVSGDKHAHQSEWTKFGESPRNRGPLQFHNSVDHEKDLPHPVAVRPPLETSVPAGSRLPSSRDSRSYSAGTVPLPHPSHVTTPGTLQGVPERDVSMAPPPPPRSWHSRSASLDLQGHPVVPQPNIPPQPKSLPHQPPPPQLPPRSSPTQLNKRQEGASSESDNDSKQHLESKTIPDTRPEKPPRVSKTPMKNVSFANVSEASHRELPVATVSLPLLINVDIPVPTVQEIEKMTPKMIADILGQFRHVLEGLSKQNIDLQQQLTEVVLKKRTAESQLHSEVQKEKLLHK